MADLLGRLVLAESPSLVPGSETAALELLSDELERTGFQAACSRGTTPATTCSPARGARRRRPLPADRWATSTLCGHSEAPSGCRRGRDDGRFYGPGTYDMKGGLVQIVFALRALRDLGLEPAVAPASSSTRTRRSGASTPPGN